MLCWVEVHCDIYKSSYNVSNNSAFLWGLFWKKFMGYQSYIPFFTSLPGEDMNMQQQRYNSSTQRLQNKAFDFKSHIARNRLNKTEVIKYNFVYCYYYVILCQSIFLCFKNSVKSWLRWTKILLYGITTM
jgi:hypothetical protein